MDVCRCSYTGIIMNIVFDKSWFQKHQSKLIWLANSWLGKYVFQFDKLGHFPEYRIVKITPSSIGEIIKARGTQVTIREYFFGFNAYARKLYFYLYPVWLLMHLWDLFADTFTPRLSFGFSTLTANPVAGANSPCDGDMEATSRATWSAAQTAATADTVNVTLSNTFVLKASKNSAVDWTVRRSVYNFDTSSLTSAATISSAVFSIAGQGSAPSNTDSTTIDVVQATPSATNDIATSDFPNVGTTVYATMNSSSWVATSGVFNDFTLSASGRSNISKTGVSSFGLRLGRDTTNTAPTGANDLASFYADNGSNLPKLVVTYITANHNPDFLLMFSGPQPQQ